MTLSLLFVTSDFGHDRNCEEKLCQHECTNLNGTGFICHCRPGYRVDPDSTYTCIDINECEQFGICPQICKNTKGSYDCECASGYRRVGNGDKCEAEGPTPLLLLPENIRIRRFNLQTQAYHDFLQEEERIMALDYDFDHNSTGLSMVYFTVASQNSVSGAIKRAYIPSVDDGSNNIGAAVDLDIKYITSPDGIAVDWVGRNLYWADSRLKRLEVAMLDGRYRKHLVKTELGYPSAVAVNPRLGMLYWADRGNDPKIECSWLDGQQRKVLVSEQLGWPTGLSIDYANNDRIYWSDSKESRIESVLPSGEGRRTAVFIDVKNPLSVSVFEDNVYWSTQEKGEVIRQNKFGRGAKTKLLTAGPWLTQVSVYQKQRYNSLNMKNPCKGICSHLCLLRPEGYTCACPEGTSFVPNSNTECDAGSDPPPTMPPPCQCQNGGTCYFNDNNALCRCPPSWFGTFCEKNQSRVLASSAGIAIGVTLLVVVLLVALVYTVRKKSNFLERLRENLPSMPSMPSMPDFSRFRNDSPSNILRTEMNDTSLNAAAVPVPNMLPDEKSFENPAYEAGAQATSTVTGLLAPNGRSFQHQTENLNNPLYMDELQVVNEPTKDSAANKEALVSDAHNSEITLSSQPPDTTGDHNFMMGFTNPIFTEHSGTESDI